ncbi:hypothetical protein HYD71_00850 [Mycoplasmopsis bovis]|nr:hypothetical protein [Mycoplasmopsis bovis]QQH49460.1 hypothetical protein HYD71_00850 [Mycoplasmopsis bovis]
MFNNTFYDASITKVTRKLHLLKQSYITIVTHLQYDIQHITLDDIGNDA